MIGKKKTEPEPEPEPAQRVCDACRTAADFRNLVLITVQQIEVWTCRDPVACRLRAQHAGIYPVPA